MGKQVLNMFFIEHLPAKKKKEKQRGIECPCFSLYF